jgi:hypothetical protein
MSLHPNELPVPSTARGDKEAVELARIWIAEGRQEFVLASKVWDDPAAWGLLLVDLARQIAKHYALTSDDQSEYSILKRIKEGFDIEWEHPTE